MNLDQAIAGRRAVREYTSQAVDEPVIRHLVAAAQQAPSAFNEQPWTFTILRDRALLDRISREATAHMLAILPVGGPSDHARSLLGAPDFHMFHHAPVLILISAAAAGPFIVEDCALAAENLMLAAHAAGLGSCWIGFAQAFLNTAQGKALLGLPAAWVPVAPLILGHPRTAPAPVPRREPTIRWVG
jgi:nitroreductase